MWISISRPVRFSAVTSRLLNANLERLHLNDTIIPVPVLEKSLCLHDIPTNSLRLCHHRSLWISVTSCGDRCGPSIRRAPYTDLCRHCEWQVGRSAACLRPADPRTALYGVPAVSGARDHTWTRPVEVVVWSGPVCLAQTGPAWCNDWSASTWTLFTWPDSGAEISLHDCESRGSPPPRAMM